MNNIYYFKYCRKISIFVKIGRSLPSTEMYYHCAIYIYDLISHNQDKHLYYDTIPDTNIRFYAINMLIIR